MKQIPQNEMDVLLRKLSADNATAAQVQSSHLDPDELSAYAENVLPPAARAKYTEHLVDCTTCRRIVADLTPFTVLVSKKEDEKPSGIREFFSNLTTTSFLRYAVPSLAAVLILAMGFFVFNRQREMRQVKQMVAQNESHPTTSSDDQGQAPAGSISSAVNKEQLASPAEKAPEKTATVVARSQGTPASPSVDEVNAEVESQKRTEADRKDAARQAAAEPPPAPQVASTAATGERELAKSKMAENKKEPVAESRPVKEEARKLDDYDAAANAPKSQPAPQTRRARGAAPAGMTTGGRDSQSKDNNESNESSETRRVAGRNFRKVNGVWTDTAYDGRETTNLSRGSEQFRALVADEPSLRTIAEQLDGQVVVVWKGRAYRIR